MALKLSCTSERLHKFISKLTQKEKSSSYSAYFYSGIQSIEPNLKYQSTVGIVLAFMCVVWSGGLRADGLIHLDLSGLYIVMFGLGRPESASSFPGSLLFT